MRMYDYDVLVIGAGIAGFVASVTANGLGKKVGIVENRKLGGNCTSFTCIPSKALIRSAHIAHTISDLNHFGLNFRKPPTLETDGVMPRVRSVVQQAYEKDAPETFERIGIKVLLGNPEFVDRHRISIDDQVISSEKFIIATGTKPLIPPIEGIEGIDYLTNELVFELEELPKSLMILGGGIDGLEYASAFGRLGVEVTIVEMATKLLPMVERELADLLIKYLEGDGIRVLTGTKALRFSQSRDKKRLEVESETQGKSMVEAEAVLVTIGRKANVDGLSLEKAGVKYGPKGIIADSKLRTSAQNIYACGDIVGPYQLASTAEYQGILAATNAVLPIKKNVDYTNAVFVIFTEPTIGYLGLTEDQARQQYGDRIRVYRFEYEQMRRALVDGTEHGVAKLISDKNGKLLGAHVIGEAAGEVIHELQVIKAYKKPLHSLYSITHAYPTYAQAIVGRASQLAYLDKMANNYFVNLVLNFWPGYHNRLALARMRLAETSEATLLSQRGLKKVHLSMDEGEGAVSKLEINAIRVSDQTCIVEMPERVTDYDETPIVIACLQAIPGDLRNIILNFGAVKYLNGLGTSMLVKLSAKVRNRGQQLSVYNLSNHYHNVFRVTGLDMTIRIYHSREEALIASGELPTASEIYNIKGIDSGEGVDTERWAEPVSKMNVPDMPADAINVNVEGRRPVGPVEGFGPLWQKVYSQRLSRLDIHPQEAIKVLKENFPSFQPLENRFYPSSAGIEPGEIVLINSSTPGGPVYTGIMVLYADDESFTFITPQGHPESGWVSFNAYDDGGTTVVQIVGLARASDPVYEAAFRLIGSKVQEKIWRYVLSSMAAHLKVQPDVDVQKVCVDTGLQWSRVKNIWYNAQIRSMVYALLHPQRWIGKK
ncbi:MAG: FAD-dependent oxidoreductase [Dehalococcoidia bacterium]|nr:MAG: FAD-dependent oxidoreductase [Dehalococcoidia bacterium]